MSSESFDFVVVGSGAAGMTAALAAAKRGLSTIVLEKAETFGGSTARSGGGIWIPGNEVLNRAGVPNDPQAAQLYLNGLVGDTVSAERQQAFLEQGPQMLDFIRANTPLEFAWVPGYPDYYPENEGGLAQGRTIEPVPLDGRILGKELSRLNPPYISSRGLTITAADYRWLSLGTRHPRAALTVAKVSLRAARDRIMRRRMLSMGQALVAGLRAGLLQAGVPVRLGVAMKDLVVRDGRVIGVQTPDGEILARCGVLLASGGFEQHLGLRQQYQRAPIGTEWTVGAAENTGDGILVAQNLGAALELMDEAWWGPSLMLPSGPYFCLAERCLPGSIMVGPEGQRFVNESAPYIDAVHAMYGSGSVPAWLITDQRYRDSYVFAGLEPRRPLPRKWYAAEAVYKTDTLGELATRLQLPALEKTVTSFNEMARAGVDEDFHRGDSVYDRYYGDPRQQPNPCLGELTKPPFYAFRMVPGDLGTKGGLLTDPQARVLREDGTVIDGLYAAGNASATVMGRSYAGAGATIGPAMTFGYLAAHTLAS